MSPPTVGFRLRCAQCAAGSYSSESGSSVCEACKPGSFGNRLGHLEANQAETEEVGKKSAQKKICESP